MASIHVLCQQTQIPTPHPPPFTLPLQSPFQWHTFLLVHLVHQPHCRSSSHPLSPHRCPPPLHPDLLGRRTVPTYTHNMPPLLVQLPDHHLQYAGMFTTSNPSCVHCWQRKQPTWTGQPIVHPQRLHLYVSLAQSCSIACILPHAGTVPSPALPVLPPFPPLIPRLCDHPAHPKPLTLCPQLDDCLCKLQHNTHLHRLLPTHASWPLCCCAAQAPPSALPHLLHYQGFPFPITLLSSFIQ